MDEEEDEGQLAGPAGLLTVQILEAELPERVGLKGRSEGAPSPYAVVVLTSHWCEDCLDGPARKGRACTCMKKNFNPHVCSLYPSELIICSTRMATWPGNDAWFLAAVDSAWTAAPRQRRQPAVKCRMFWCYKRTCSASICTVGSINPKRPAKSAYKDPAPCVAPFCLAFCANDMT